MKYGEGVSYDTLPPEVKPAVDKIVDELAGMLDIDFALGRQASSFFANVYWNHVDSEWAHQIPLPMNSKMVDMAVAKYKKKLGL